jgi:hypothetical protein
LAVALVGCGSAPRVARYRFTVEVDDNGGIVSGSSVQEEHCTFNDGFFKQIGNALNCGVKGEAVVVDLGAKGQLFVLLTQDKTRPRASGNARGIFEAAHFDLFVNRSMTAAVFDRVAAYKEPVTARAVNMHLMVRFLNVDDPRSAKPVDPELRTGRETGEGDRPDDERRPDDRDRKEVALADRPTYSSRHCALPGRQDQRCNDPSSSRTVIRRFLEFHGMSRSGETFN